MRKLSLMFFLMMATPALAQNAATIPLASQPQPSLSPQSFIMKQSGGDMSQKLQQGMAAAVLMNCVNKQAGKDRTEAFYNDIQATGKQAGADCKTGQYDAARALVLAKLDEKKNDPMLPIIHNCYMQQQANVSGIAGPQVAADIAKYDRWALNPAQAHAEMTDHDICKKAPAGVTP